MFLRSFAPIYGLIGFLFGGYYALWQNELLSHGFEFSQLATLIAIQTLISTLINIPSGVFADRIGHKRTTLFGFSIYCAAFSLPCISPSRFFLAGAVLLVGVANAFVQGALESWAVELQEESERVLHAKRFVERDQFQRVGMIFGALAIPFLVSRFGNSRLAWTTYCVLALVLLLAGALTPKASHEKPHVSLAEQFQLFRLREVAQSGNLAWLLLGIFIFGMSDGVVSATFWPHVRQFGVTDAAIFGLIQTTMSLSRLAGLQAWKRTRWIEHPRLPGASLAASSALFFVFGYTGQPIIAAVAWIARIFIISVYFSTIQAVLLRNEQAKRLRATVLSAAGVLGSLGMVASTSAIGALSSNNDDAAIVLQVGAFLSLFAGLIIFYMAPRMAIHKTTLATPQASQ